MFTGDRHWTLRLARSIQSTTSHYISLRSTEYYIPIYALVFRAVFFHSDYFPKFYKHLEYRLLSSLLSSCLKHPVTLRSKYLPPVFFPLCETQSFTNKQKAGNVYRIVYIIRFIDTVSTFNLVLSCARVGHSAV